MTPRRRRISRRQRRDRQAFAVQIAGLEAIADGRREPANLREDLYLNFIRHGLNPDPRDFVLSRPLALAERAEMQRARHEAPTPSDPTDPPSLPAPA